MKMHMDNTLVARLVAVGKFLVISSIAIGLLSSCSREIENKTPTGLAGDTPPAPANVQVALVENGAIITWTISDSSLVSQYRIYVSESGINGQYSPAGATAARTFTLSNLVSGREYFVSIAAVTSSGFEGDRSVPAPAFIGTYSMTINGGAKFANNRQTSLNFFLTTPGATSVRLSEDSTFAGATWGIFASLKNFTLSEGDGVKWVYAQVQFADGSELKNPLADSIILDTRAEIDSVRHVPAGVTFSAGDTVLFRVYTQEPGGSASVRINNAPITLYDDGTTGDVIAGNGIYTRRYIIPTEMEVTDAQIAGAFIDEAGNRASDVTDPSLLNVANAPTPVTISGLAISSSEIRLQWTQSTATDFASYRIHRKTGAGGGAVTTNDELVTTITSRATTTVVDDELNQTTVYRYKVFVFDNTNLSSQSNELSVTTLANQAPTAVQLGGRIDSAQVVLTWTRNNDTDFESYRITRSTQSDMSNAQSVGVVNSQSQTEFRLLYGGGTYYFRVSVFDKQGASANSNTVSVP